MCRMALRLLLCLSELHVAWRPKPSTVNALVRTMSRFRHWQYGLRAVLVSATTLGAGCADLSANIDLEDHERTRLLTYPLIRVVQYDSTPELLAIMGTQKRRNLDALVDVLMTDRVGIPSQSPMPILIESFVAGVSDRLKPTLLQVESKPLNRNNFDPSSEDSQRLVQGVRPAFVFQKRYWNMENWKIPDDRTGSYHYMEGGLTFEVRVNLVLPVEDKILWRHTCRKVVSRIETEKFGPYDLTDRRQFRALIELMQGNRGVVDQISTDAATSCAQELIESFSPRDR